MAKKKKEKEEVGLKYKAFVVMNASFEYNDEYYSQPDGEPGTAVKVYMKKEAADEACFKANISELLSCDLSSYSWQLRDSKDGVEEVKQAVRDAGGKFTESDYEFKITSLPKKVTKEQVDNIISALGVSFCSVEEVEIDIDM
jgi:hypothetical protein